MIGYGWKGPFHICDPETEEEKKEAEEQIRESNKEMEDDAEEKK
jgi:hypothetical protein